MAGFLLGALLVDRGQLVFIDEVDFAAEKGLDAVLFRLFEKASQPVEHPVVGDGERLHSQFLCSLAELVHTATTIQQTMVCMNVEVDEFGIFFWHRRSQSAGALEQGKQKLFTVSLANGL